MKLAEALIRRADLQKGTQELAKRVNRNAKRQEDVRSSEDPETLIERYEENMKEIEELMIKINKTNISAKIETGEPLVDVLAHRDILKLRHKFYKNLAEEATPEHDRYSHTEIKFISSVNVEKIQYKADCIAKEHRFLDMKIQRANWDHDLID